MRPYSLAITDFGDENLTKFGAWTGRSNTGKMASSNTFLYGSAKDVIPMDRISEFQ